MTQRKSFRTQFLSGAGAEAYSQTVTIFTQLIAIPAMVTLWGASTYGSWLAISALPAYFSIADLGMGQISGTEMTMAVARGDRNYARAVNQAAWFTIASIALCIPFLAALLGALIPLAEILKVAPEQSSQTLPAFVMLSCSAAMSLAFGALGGGLKTVNKQWLAIVITATNRLVSFIGLLLVAALGGGFLAASVFMVVAQSLLFGATGIWFYRHERWLKPTGEVPEWKLVRLLVGPSLSYMFYYLSNLFTIQGVTVLVSASLGPAMVVVLQAIRTLTRLGRMASTIVIHAIQPVFAQLASEETPDQRLRIFRLLVISAMAGSMAYFIGMTTLGPNFLRYWTKDVVVGYNKLLYLMTAAIVFEIMWFTLQTPFTSTNRHSVFAVWLLVLSAAGLLANIVLLPVLGVTSAGWTLLGTHVLMLLVTLWKMRGRDI
ncbi:lipopolysaccharide biosynthesis protein [Paracoccus benzoatiresistens]|uniref:Membrane protein involved in the export of O-antigen and teichoic acid n=1 Tax=Paracoccus benzoatiresistens TaxID=2997341 RepID=A0ABT4J9D1_9RHOB|nr:hypothetical protein [Paracoccus sp. EF6]MCZ0963691.1 hypothetical protein [Paracoccus sp. EF6]